MGDSLTTHSSLLARLRDARDAQAWERFVEIYTPLVYRLARSQGFQDADAADVAQDVLRSVAVAMPRFEYDPGRGAFRSWLFTIARQALARASERRGREARGSGDTDAHRRLAEHPARDDDAERWEREYEQRLLDWSAAQIRGEFQPATWDAFWRTAVAGEHAPEVAASLGLTVVAVYNAKSRVLARLKATIEANRCE